MSITVSQWIVFYAAELLSLAPDMRLEEAYRYAVSASVTGFEASPESEARRLIREN